jgi:hypothetical protein
VNRLVKALLERPDVIDLAVQREAAPFDLLLETLGDALLTGPERESIGSDMELIQRLRAGYLQTITAPVWEAALTLAEGAPVREAGWWTVMLPASNGRRGLTVPQDSAEAELVALFTGPTDDARTLVYDPTTSSVADLLETHCSNPPIWGLCVPGTCGGCRAQPVWDPATNSKSIMCRCPDLAE